MHSPGLARALRVHGSQHSTSDLHRTILRGRANPYLAGVHSIKETQTVVVELPQVLGAHVPVYALAQGPARGTEGGGVHEGLPPPRRRTW